MKSVNYVKCGKISPEVFLSLHLVVATTDAVVMSPHVPCFRRRVCDTGDVLFEYLNLIRAPLLIISTAQPQ